ncbi:hypothetical protein QVD17_27621 [Tagetes erecta]|uniref:HMA domain-containing protein n=1 Tax=Tagetes erecta TaxID=13708 RepID=A0AAD8KBR8_TARER|nr:hypothetical protein QVD17_27621 [Tagetes erecta]
MNRWKTALTEIANLTGEKLSGSETEFITKLVKIIKCELDLKQLSTPEHIIGMEARVEAINRWLINDHCSAIAICGMGGSGKTTLAKHIYNINRQHFESSSFIKVTGTQPHGLLGLQKQLLNDGSDTIEGLALDMRRVEQGDILETPALKTNSVAKMEKLKWLLLKYVEFVGSYENFPNLVWLGWHGCPLQTLPLGLLTSSLVTLDMSYGQLQSFEAPTVLNSLKTLNLKGCEKLVDVCKLNQLPELEKLILCNCSNLTHLCKSISDLKRLEILDLTGCAKLWKHVNQPAETTIIPLLSLPKSLERLDLTSCNLEFKNDVCVPFHTQSPFLLDLSCNPFTRLSDNIDFTMIRELTLYSCPNVKSLPCLPSTLVMLFIDWCTSLERVTFQSGRFSLKALGYECCFKLSEIQGLFKLVPVADIDEADLGQMQWIKAYQHQKVDLVGDDITKGRIWNIQMLYEYGIKSTYLSDTAYQSMPAYNYTSPSDFISFRVPSRDHKNMARIQGLHVSCLYGSKDANIPFLYVKISNKTKGLTWVYNPLVYCKPRVNETVVWLSYWPIGNILDSGDEVHVRIIVEPEMMIVSGCGASLQYMDGEVFRENNIIQDEEVIGGDLSEFDVATQSYYLCRRDIFNVNTLKGLKNMFDDDVHYPDSQRWKKTHQLDQYLTLRNYVNASLKTIELRVGLTSESEIDKIEKAISSLAGVESVTAHNEMGKLTVSGHFDPIEVATCVREFDNEVEILSVTHLHPPLIKMYVRSKVITRIN